MNIRERQAHLIEQINAINNEQILDMLEESLVYYTHSGAKDITDDLNEHQLRELSMLLAEPSEKDTVSLEEFKAATSKWRTKS